MPENESTGYIGEGIGIADCVQTSWGYQTPPPLCSLISSGIRCGQAVEFLLSSIAQTVLP